VTSDAVLRAVQATPLVDHHAHSVVGEVPGRAAFEGFLSESSEPPPPGCSNFDSFLGIAVLRTCGPLLDLPPSTGADEYLVRRRELGGPEVNRRLLRASRPSALLVDPGYRAGELLDGARLSAMADVPVYRIVRLEQLAEDLAAEGTAAGGFPDAFAERLHLELTGPDAAVGCKSVLAYRGGLAVDPSEPDHDEVVRAASRWLASAGHAGALRITDPVLERHLLWTALRAGVPLQLHTGYGDGDLDLARSDPALLTDLIRLASPLGTPIVLLHCYPYHRQAAYLAGVYPHVYFDVGLALNYVGHRAATVLAESLESAPVHKMLYSSDGFGLAELHALAAIRFREALAEVLGPLRSREQRSEREVARLAALICSGNARRIYRLPGAPACDGVTSDA
jgi:uncharacterized protein